MIQTIYTKTGTKREQIALIHNGHKISYGQLEERIDRTAQMLWNNGIRVKDRVAIILPNCPEFIYTVFGAWKIGACVIPLDFRLKKDEYMVVLEETEPKMIITAENAASVTPKKVVDSAIMSLGAVDTIMVLTKDEDFKTLDEVTVTEDVMRESGEEDFIAMIQYTSGTTGRPKGIVKKANAFAYEAQSFAKHMGYGKQDVILVVIPLYHAYAFGDALISGLYGGATLLLEERFTGRDQLHSVQTYGVTVFPGVPFMFSMFNQLYEVQEYDVSTLRLCISAGAPLPEDVNRAFQQRFGINIYSLYGSSETNTICVNCDLDRNGCYQSVGTAIEGVEISIRDEQGNLLAPGITGDIWVKSKIAGCEYFRQPKLTASVFKDGYVITGDVGHLDEKGLLYITGRKKSFINVGGEKVDPSEIESVVKQHPRVKECAVVGVPDSMGGEVVKAVIVPVEGENIVRSEIIDWCAAHLAPFKMPRIISFMEALPLSPTGKILRKRLI